MAYSPGGRARTPPVGVLATHAWMAVEASSTPDGSAVWPAHTATGCSVGGRGLQKVMVEPTKPPVGALDSATTRMRPDRDVEDDEHVQPPVKGFGFRQPSPPATGSSSWNTSTAPPAPRHTFKLDPTMPVVPSGDVGAMTRPVHVLAVPLPQEQAPVNGFGVRQLPPSSSCHQPRNDVLPVACASVPGKQPNALVPPKGCPQSLTASKNQGNGAPAGQRHAPSGVAGLPLKQADPHVLAVHWPN